MHSLYLKLLIMWLTFLILFIAFFIGYAIGTTLIKKDDIQILPNHMNEIYNYKLIKEGN